MSSFLVLELISSLGKIRNIHLKEYARSEYFDNGIFVGIRVKTAVSTVRLGRTIKEIK